MPTAGDRFNELVAIMAQLRSPEGCPWDRVQTLASLRPYLLEETYEALEALDSGDTAALCEELGDLLLEVVFLSRIAEENGTFSVSDAIDAIVKKLVRRHPHVFGADAKLSTPHEVRGKWEEMKASERSASAAPKTILGGVPKTLPSLLRAYDTVHAPPRLASTGSAPATSSTKSKRRFASCAKPSTRATRPTWATRPTRSTWATRPTWATSSKKRLGTSCLRSPTFRGSSASSQRRRCAAPTTSSSRDFRKWSGASRLRASECRRSRSTSSRRHGRT